MNNRPGKLAIVTLAMISLTWSTATYAFFCFSFSGGSKQRHSQYRSPPPFVGYRVNPYPAYAYSPAMPATEAYIDGFLPADPGGEKLNIRRQHIFE